MSDYEAHHFVSWIVWSQLSGASISSRPASQLHIIVVSSPHSLSFPSRAGATSLLSALETNVAHLSLMMRGWEAGRREDEVGVVIYPPRRDRLV